MKKDVIEIDLHVEASDLANCECGICDEEECPCPCHHEKAEAKVEDKAVAFSIKIVEALTSKAEKHNKRDDINQVSPEELLGAFREGASFKGFEASLTELGMANANLFLRIKSKKFKDIILSRNEKNTKKELSCLIFDLGRDSILNNTELDMFASIMPQNTDFDEAKKDIEQYDLNYNFKDIKELYLDEYEPMPLEID